MTEAEMVRLCTEKVMGWKVEQHGFERAWNPFTSDADCWQMVDKLLETGIDLQCLQKHPGCDWNCEFNMPIPGRERKWFGASNPDRRRAIVTACLRAVGEVVA